MRSLAQVTAPTVELRLQKTSDIALRFLLALNNLTNDVFVFPKIVEVVSHSLNT